MALKENINAIKQGISTEEQFLESLIKGERFFKKYKWLIIGVVVATIIGLIGYSVNKSLKNKRAQEANVAYVNLMKNPEDKTSLKILKESNTALYGTYLAATAFNKSNQKELEMVLASDADALLKELASYELSGEGDSGLLSNLTFLQKGYAKLQNGDSEGAKSTFSKIDLTSPLQNIVKNLQHYEGK